MRYDLKNAIFHVVQATQPSDGKYERGCRCRLTGQPNLKWQRLKAAFLAHLIAVVVLSG